jgi:hypothetical protein
MFVLNYTQVNKYIHGVNIHSKIILYTAQDRYKNVILGVAQSGHDINILNETIY